MVKQNSFSLGSQTLVVFNDQETKRYWKIFWSEKKIIKIFFKFFSITINFRTNKNVSYYLESLFTNVLVKETIVYIADQIYVKKKLVVCAKWICKRLLLKHATECKFNFSVLAYKKYLYGKSRK